MSAVPIITIDGPSGTGKGSIANSVAKLLNWHILDSGVLYRAVAYLASQQEVSFTDEKSLTHLAQDLSIFFDESDPTVRIILNEQDVSDLLRTELVGAAASQLAALSFVRTALLTRQREFARWPGLVADGRDMGTTIFPDATVKIFLDADPVERAKRRTAQLQAKGLNVTLSRVLLDFESRDFRDGTRRCSAFSSSLRCGCSGYNFLWILMLFFLGVMQLIQSAGFLDVSI